MQTLSSDTKVVSSFASAPTQLHLHVGLAILRPAAVSLLLTGTWRKVFMRQIAETTVVYGDHIVSSTPGLSGNGDRTDGPELWEAVPRSYVCLPQIEVHHPRAGNLVSGFIFMGYLHWLLSSKQPWPARE